MDGTGQLRDRVRRVVDAAAGGVVRVGRHGGRGCGFVIDRGVVVTNAHNLRDRTTEITFADGRAVQARALGMDVDGDLAVLEVDTGDATPLTWATEPVELGDPVFAVVRTPDGTRVTSGSVSGVDRSFRGPRGRRITGAVEHTAPLARGSSGSPVVDESGAVVGITTLRLGDGFFVALPASDELRARIHELRAGRAPRRRLLGVALAPAHITRRLRRAVGLPDRQGVLVRVVEPGSAAERAGLKAGDLITSVGDNDTEVTSADDVAAALDAVPDGGALRLHVVRGTDEIDLAAPLDAESADQASDHGEA
jgi:S1-C subfamily serine protease